MTSKIMKLSAKMVEEVNEEEDYMLTITLFC